MNKSIFMRLFFAGFLSFACLSLTAMERRPVVYKYDIEDFKNKFKQALESNDLLAEAQRLMLLLPMLENLKVWQELTPAIQEYPITFELLKRKLSRAELKKLRDNLLASCRMVYELKEYLQRFEEYGRQHIKSQLFRPYYVKLLVFYGFYICILFVIRSYLAQSPVVELEWDYNAGIQSLIASGRAQKEDIPLLQEKYQQAYQQLLQRLSDEQGSRNNADSTLAFTSAYTQLEIIILVVFNAFVHSGYFNAAFAPHEQRYRQIYDILDTAVKKVKSLAYDIEVYLNIESEDLYE